MKKLAENCRAGVLRTDHIPRTTTPRHYRGSGDDRITVALPDDGPGVHEDPIGRMNASV